MKKKIVLMILALLMLIITLIGTTYAIFTYTKIGTTENVIETGALKFLYTENDGVGSGINMTNAKPVPDEIGRQYATENNVFDFSIEATNTSDKEIEYEITLNKDSTSTLSEEAVKVYLVEMNGETEKKILSPTLYSNLSQTKMDTNQIEKSLYYASVPTNTQNYVKNYRLKMWVSEDIDFESGNYDSKIFITTVNVYANVDVIKEKNTYKEKILNGTDPVLGKGLIPVIISDKGEVTKANVSNEWYNYENKEWANAVILKNENIVYKNNEIIPESNIESYFVWIPRYKYKIFDVGNYTTLTTIEKKEQIIEIVFENKNTTPSNGAAKGTWLTHPAFTSFDSNGFWVGKFETGYDGAISTEAAQANTDKVDISKIVIKPNVYSWRGIAVGKMFKNSYDYNRNLDSHMIKNTEWGAVAYLQHSLYGSAISVRVNNNSDFITGYAAIKESTLGYNSNGESVDGNRFESTSLGIDGTYTVNYLNPASTVASTTNNITGVYDMGGGVYEYVMGYSINATNDLSELTSLYSNFFNDSAYIKYWDKYSSTTNINYNNRILGDATGEMGPFGRQTDPDGSLRPKSSWYGDELYFVTSNHSWIIRGGGFDYGLSAGIFSARSNRGSAQTNNGFRIVLTP